MGTPAQSAVVIQPQPWFFGLSNTFQYKPNEPSLSWSSVALPTIPTGLSLPLTTGSEGGSMVTTGASLMGSVNKIQPAKPSTPDKENSKIR